MTKEMLLAIGLTDEQAEAVLSLEQPQKKPLTLTDFVCMSERERLQLKQSDPDLFRRFTAALRGCRR